MDYNQNHIDIYPLAEGHYRVLGKIFSTGVKQPTDMAFDKKGNMYVLDYSLEKITVYSPLKGTPQPHRER